ncbi:hypothetical protein QFW80_04160 [Luteimonas sp. M1R5S18]|uniref:Uncharacterized protein n=1 Tax=Luteimonas rhizosphaericola TaxID=3042024 RepID=A0ABT6JGB5_9GAMM|nr:hypothetical protein [Luteimonas rhizosphaericola]MDH5829712.1 hypothetical protein [Luteimonas rhizosphaericola]
MKTFWKLTRWARALRFWFFIIAAGLAYLGCSGEARAQTCNPSPAVNGGNCTRPEALAMCNEQRLAYSPNPNHTVCALATNSYIARTYPGGSWITGAPHHRYQFYWSNECPAGSAWDPATNTCTRGCATKPSLPNRAFPGTGGACVEGCAYSVVFDPSTPGASGTLEIGGTAYHWGTLAPTGAECSTTTEVREHNPNRSTCVATGGGFSECVEPSGRHCVTGAQGGRYCWEPGQTGPRSNSQGTEGATRTPEGETPRKPPNMPDATGTTGATTTINNTTTTTTTYTGSGGTPGQGETGEGGRDGPGSGDGTGDGEGEGDGPGSPGATPGDQYEPGEATVGSVVSDYLARIGDAPIIDAVGGFFEVSASGSCPTWTRTFFGKSVTIDFFCMSEMQPVYTGIGICMLVVFAWAAFRIGFLD